MLPDLGTMVRTAVAALVAHEHQSSPLALLYAEKRDGFQCGTCRYVTPVNGTHGRCQIMTGTVHLTEGCCVAWDYAPSLLLVKEVTS